ncbi:hypothetical protein EIP91_007769 [Steccherinum ochraceum]|uniref:Uncharacterized protein n=1 Tax=Steccherinum ochraceum TaxID=92696 RepID=A0A4R0RQH9_9APHY|nr:hypothetical protein EIP91_007769 [Steccherinum ochraceum]
MSPINSSCSLSEAQSTSDHRIGVNTGLFSIFVGAISSPIFWITAVIILFAFTTHQLYRYWQLCQSLISIEEYTEFFRTMHQRLQRRNAEHIEWVQAGSIGSPPLTSDAHAKLQVQMVVLKQ